MNHFEQKIKVWSRIKECCKTWEYGLIYPEEFLPRAATSVTEATAELRHLHRVIFDHATRNDYDTHRKLVRDIAGRTQ